MVTKYADDIYDAAKAAGWTSAQVAEASFNAVAVAAGFTSSTTPQDFFYRNLRRFVAHRILMEELDASDTSVKAAIRSKVQELASHPNVDVEVVRKGDSVEVEGPALIIRKVVS